MKAFDSLVQALAAFAPPRSFFTPREPRWFGVPLDRPLKLKRCDPSRHNSKRRDQIERQRKIRKRTVERCWCGKALDTMGRCTYHGLPERAA